MLFVAIIENIHESEVLLCKIENKDPQDCWSLPFIVSSKENNDAIKDLLEYCRTKYGCSVESDSAEIFYEDDTILAIKAQPYSYKHSRDDVEFSWVKTDEILALNTESRIRPVFLLLHREYAELSSIRSKIKQHIQEVASKFSQYGTVEIQETKCGVGVFVKYYEKVICPFGFRFDFETHSETINYVSSIFLTRSFAEGDKTDIYVMFSNCMSLLHKLVFGVNIYIDYMSLFDEVEINAASLVFLEEISSVPCDDADNILTGLEKSFVRFIASLMIFGDMFGSFLNERDDSAFSQKYLDYFCTDDDKYNCFSRKESQFYSDFARGIMLISLNSRTYKPELFNNVRWEAVDSINGKILCQFIKDDNSPVYSFISSEVWGLVCDVVEKMNLKDYALICQNSSLYLLEGKNIWIFTGNFSEYNTFIEVEKVKKKIAHEQALLFFNRNFEWLYPVSFSRFEELMADLYEKEDLVQSVRLLGRSNCPDGGRDILIWKAMRTGEVSYGSKLIIGQCKAYKHSVNKKHVTDIRDTIENYDAHGFHLFASSVLTVPLIDNLLKLRERFDSDWWTEREIFQRLRQHPELVIRYSDIVSVLHNPNDTSEVVI